MVASFVVPEQETYKSYRVSLNEAFFDLKVLDPAMGSGHFLVEVVDYTSSQTCAILGKAFRSCAVSRRRTPASSRAAGRTTRRTTNSTSLLTLGS
jgi:hypothetical protein